MPAPASQRSRRALPLASLALGLSLAASIPVAASAKTLPDPHWMHREGRDGEVSSLLLTAGSGATVAVQICDGEVHAATAAGGTNALPLLALGCEDPGNDTAVLALGSTGGIAAATGGLALTAPAGAAPSLADLAVANAAAGAADGPGMMEAHHAAMHGGGMMDMGMDMGMGGMHAAPAADGYAGHEGRGGHGRLMGLSRGEGHGRAMREARAGRGGRGANGGPEAAVGGLVSALPSTGSGGAGDPLLALASAIAAAGAAGSGLALRRRTFPN